MGFPDNSVGKESTCNLRDPSSIPGLGRSPGEGTGYPLQYSWASLVAQLVKNSLQCRRPWFDSWVRKICWRRDRLPTPIFLGFPGGSDGKEYACNVGDLGSIPGWGKSPAEGNGNPLQYSCLENPIRQRSLAGYNPWSHKDLNMTELYLPGKSHRQRSLVGCSP